jgi:hypothetical protein
MSFAKGTRPGSNLTGNNTNFSYFAASFRQSLPYNFLLVPSSIFTHFFIKDDSSYLKSKNPNSPPLCDGIFNVFNIFSAGDCVGFLC